MQIFSFSFPGEKSLKKARAERRESISNNSPNEPMLVNNILALKTGGAAYTLSSGYTKENIADALKKFITELRSQFVIGYASPKQKQDNRPRSLRVEIADNQKGEKRQGIVRENFIVPKD